VIPPTYAIGCCLHYRVNGGINHVPALRRAHFRDDFLFCASGYRRQDGSDEIVRGEQPRRIARGIGCRAAPIALTKDLPASTRNDQRLSEGRRLVDADGGLGMILVTGSILAREDTFDDVLRSCLEHVERSRKEPGCISHDVHVDCQNPMRLFFFEQWADEAALRTHFAVEGSKAFVRSLKGRIVETSGTKIYRAEAIPR
jgi:quinol monooxygenase YgiN